MWVLDCQCTILASQLSNSAAVTVQSQRLGVSNACDVITWGDNSYGQFGYSTPANKTAPYNTGPSNIIDVSVGDYHILLLNSSGAVYSSGFNMWGQLGNAGSAASRSSFAQITSLGSSVIKIAAGGRHSIAIKSDKRVWVWGNNASGQLGDGAVASTVTSPKEIMVKTFSVNTQSNILGAGTAGGTVFVVNASYFTLNTPHPIAFNGTPPGVTVNYPYIQLTGSVSSGNGTFLLYTAGGTPEGSYPMSISIGGITSDFILSISSGTVKTVTVGAQAGTLTTSASGSVTYSVVTTGIANGTYPATLKNAPAGVTMAAGNIVITNNTSTLTLNSTGAAPQGTYPLTLTINGIISENFNLVVLGAITITSQPTASTTVTQGAISGNLSVEASAAQGIDLNYQWYSNTTDGNSGGTLIPSATDADFMIPPELEAGTYYYYCVISATGDAIAKFSDVAVVTVVGPQTGITLSITTSNTYDVVLIGENITDFEKTFTLTYDSSNLQLIDFAAQTPAIDTSIGIVPGTDLTILSHSPNGVVTFKVNTTLPAGSEYNDVLTILRVKALNTGETMFYLSMS